MCTHTCWIWTLFEAFLLSLWSELPCLWEVPPSQHGPAFQNSLLGNLETDLKGKIYGGPIIQSASHSYPAHMCTQGRYFTRHGEKHWSMSSNCDYFRGWNFFFCLWHIHVHPQHALLHWSGTLSRGDKFTTGQKCFHVSSIWELYIDIFPIWKVQCVCFTCAWSKTSTWYMVQLMHHPLQPWLVSIPSSRPMSIMYPYIVLAFEALCALTFDLGLGFSKTLSELLFEEQGLQSLLVVVNSDGGKKEKKLVSVIHL